jgi:hypothetical protein
MTTENNTPTSSAANAHEGQPAADTNPETDFFGPVIYTYTRKQALADGVQMQVPPPVAEEAGFRFPIFLTDTVHAKCVKVPDGLTDQDEDGRLWDILTMLHHAIRNNPAGAERIPFSLYVRNDEGETPSLIRLHAACGAMDLDDPRPAITVMFPEED